MSAFKHRRQVVDFDDVQPEPEVQTQTHGKNEPDDPFAEIKGRAEGKAEFARDWIDSHPVITNQADADFARNLSEECRLIVAEADPMRRAEKIPIEGALKAIDVKFKAFTVPLEDRQNTLTRLFKSYLAECEKQRRAAEMKAAEEAYKAQEAARKAAEEERELARAAGLDDSYEDDPIEIPVFAPVEQPKTFVGGAKGARASYQETFTVIEIGNYVAAYAELRMSDPKLDRAVKAAADAHVKKWKGDTNLDGCLVVSDLDGRVICDNRPKAPAPKATKKKAQK